MLIDRLHFDYERQIKDLHHHLYGNANVRTPEAIASEVLKIVKTLAFLAGSGAPAVGADGSAKADLLRDGLTPEARRAVEEVRDGFLRLNEEIKAYPAGTAIELDDPSVFAVLVYLGGFDLGSHDRDWLGDAIEIFRSLSAKRAGGQFFTHPLVTELALKLIEFKPENGGTLTDVCAGSGGFLLAGAALAPEPWRFIGLDADADLVRLANSNLTMRCGQHDEFVIKADSLAPPESWPDPVQRKVEPGAHEWLASNPPFGTKITVKDRQVLSQFALAHRWSKTAEGWSQQEQPLVPRPPDVLFIERNLRLAKPGSGRVALVTPYQLLSGPQAGFVREWLLREARVIAVVDLPPMTFQPHTGTKACLLVFERLEQPLEKSTESEDYPIFMAVADHIGHDRRGNPIFPSPESPVIETDLYDVGRAFEAFRRGADPADEFEGAFTVSSTAVAEERELRLNAAFWKPSTGSLRNEILALREKRGWHVTTIGEVTEQIFVPGRSKRNYVSPEDGVPFLSGTGISQVVPTNPKYIGMGDGKGESYLVEAGWILVTRSGSTGLVSSVPKTWDGWAISDHVIRIVPSAAGPPAGFIQAYLRSATGQALLRAGVFGSVIDEITPEHIASIPIPLPDDPKLIEQVAAEMDRAETGREMASSGIAGAIDAVEQLVA